MQKIDISKVVINFCTLFAMLFFILVLYPQAGFSENKAKSRKITRDLLVLKKSFLSHTKIASSQTFKSQNKFLRVISDRVVIDAVAAGDATRLLADLEALGLQKGAKFRRTVSGQLPIEAINLLDDLPSLKFIRPSYMKTNVGLVDNQADVAMRSNVARAIFGLDGSGVTIGTLSDSFDDLGGAADDVASGDLPDGIVVLEDLGAGGSDEGRAMMQLIHDVVPGADQAFHTAFNGQADFAQGIIDLADAGADIIVDDVFFFAEAMFQDDNIAQAVDEVAARGVAYFSSAGNSARQSYEADFVPGQMFDQRNFPTVDTTVAPVFQGGTAHDFGGGDVFQSVTVDEGSGFLLVLQWDEPYFSISGAPGTTNEVDIYVLDDPATNIIAGAAFTNFGGDAVEIFEFSNPQGSGQTEFNLMIVHNTNVAGSAPGHIKYIYFRDLTINEFDTQSSTVVGHSNAAGAEAVGAAFFFRTPEFGTDPPLLEPFSSGGPTPIFFDTAGNRLANPEVRDKPEIVAPDGTNTTFFGSDLSNPLPGTTEPDGFPNFFGTSAAAPHAAALAGLLLEADPTLTPTDINSALENTAIDMNGPGFDLDTGFGLVNAVDALTSVAGAPTLAGVGDFVWRDDNANGIQDTGEPGIPDVPVKLFASDSTVVDSTTTNGVGIYSFGALTPGDYFLRFELVENFGFSPKDADGDSVDSDVDLSTGQTDVFTLAAGDFNKTIDAGMVFTTAAVGDFVWRDDNSNGIQEPQEPGLDGVTVELFDSQAVSVGSTITAGGGFYNFEDLSAGDYFLEFTLPADFTFSPKDAVGDSMDSDVDPTTGRTDLFTLIIGPPDITWDAGMIPPPPNPGQVGVCYASTGLAGGGNILTIDPATGAGSLVGPTGLSGVPGLAINSSGEIFATERATGDLYRIDAQTGEARFITSTGLFGIDAIAFDGNDILYAISFDPPDFNLYTVNTETGVPTVVGPTGVFMAGLAFDPTTGVLWGSVGGFQPSVPDGIFTIDKTTGEATLVGTTGFSSPAAVPDLHFDAAGNLFASKPRGGSDPADLLFLDKSTGYGTLIGSIGFRAVSGLTSIAQPVAGAQNFVVPQNVDFGNVTITTTSDTITVTISNIGDADLTISDISAPGDPFAINSVPNLPVTIPSTGSEIFGVSFSPTIIGDFNSTITIASDDSDDPTITVNVVGSGIGLGLADAGVCYATTGTMGGDSSSSLLTIDLSTGVGTLIGQTGITGIFQGVVFPGVPGLAIKSTGEIFGTNVSDNADLYRINSSIGIADFVANTGLFGPDAIAFDGNDQLWAVDSNNDLYTVDDVTGATTLVGPTGVSIRGMAFDPTGGTLWGSGGNGDDGIYTIDLKTGTATLVGLTGLGGSTPDIHFDESGNLYGSKGGGGNENNLISIDGTTGAGTVIGPIGFVAVSGLAARLDRVTSVEDPESTAQPVEFTLQQNYPNPFNPTTTIRYDLKATTDVKLEIFNLLGQKVRTLVNEKQKPGPKSVVWDAQDDAGVRVATGIYIYKIVAGDFVSTRKMILLK